jgi:tRNA-dihydrouridine synthase B
MITKTQLIQAPLAGYSCAPFRILAHQWGQPDFCCTEMISVKTLLFNKKPQTRFTHKDPREGKLCYQLSSTVPNELSEAVKRVEQFGADAVDLNCGCPMQKIRSKGAGSKLLDDDKKLFALVSAMREATKLPISIKIRIEPNNHEHNQRIAKIAEEAGADFMIVHGRHWKERYDTPCRLDAIATICDAANIPVIGNGDVHDTASYQHMIAQTHCDGVMIARASVGKPWLFAQIRAELAGKIFTPPTTKQIGGMFVQHVQYLMEIEAEIVAVLQSRKLGKYYAKGILKNNEFCEQLNQCGTFDRLQALAEKHFK